jgi:hypothetical protein
VNVTGETGVVQPCMFGDEVEDVPDMVVRGERFAWARAAGRIGTAGVLRRGPPQGGPPQLGPRGLDRLWASVTAFTVELVTKKRRTR